MSHPDCICAKCEDVRRDAERYRWLIHNQIVTKEMNRDLWIVMAWNVGPASLSPSYISDAIDAARSKP